MGKKLLVLSAALFLSTFTADVNAACPNACSGHGTCGDYDSCSCYGNWEGADCADRVCPYHYSWVTTGQGDLDYDGVRAGATMYDTSHYFTTGGIGYIKTQAAPGGTWEDWPSTFNSLSKDEGHFYMECSNRGTCDRKSGVCNCFEGYTGDACRRATCPNSCSGHGVCKSLTDQLDGVTYGLWDADMGHSCVCDPGFSGPSCKDKICAKGDDPLTTGQHNEKQFIDIYTTYHAFATVGTGAEPNAFSGTIKLTYTDYMGQSYTTDSITVAPFTGTQTAEAQVAAALNGLPGDVLSGVTVTEGYCGTLIPGTVTGDGSVYAAGSDANAQANVAMLADGVDIVCPGGDVNTVFQLLTLGGMIEGQAAAATIDNTADMTCYSLRAHHCTRFTIDFQATPGDLTDLSVDVSGLSADYTTPAAVVTDTLDLAVDGANAVVWRHVVPYSTATGGTCNTGIACVVTAGAAGAGSVTLITANEAYEFMVGDTVKITCAGNVMGTYTVASHTSAQIFVVTEAISGCTGTTAGMVVENLSNVVTTNVDLTGDVSAGDQLQLGTAGTIVTVESVSYDTTPTDTTAALGYTNGGRIYVEESLTAVNQAAGAGETIQAYDKGTTESSECGDRGVCNTETGLCKCFKGYTGNTCSTQNALAAN